MLRTHWLLWMIFVFLATAIGAGYLVTARAPQAASNPSEPGAQVLQTVIADRQEFDTASQLAALAESEPEQHLARQALQIANQVLDQALRNALAKAQQDAKSTGHGGQAVLERIRASLSELDREQARKNELQEQLLQAKPPQQAALKEQIAMVEARMQFDQARLDDARNDAMRSNDTNLGLLQQIARQHDANHSVIPPAKNLPATVNLPVRGLAGAIAELWKSDTKEDALDAAQQHIRGVIQDLLRQHAALEAGIQQQSQTRPNLAAAITGKLEARSHATRAQGRVLVTQTIDLMHRLAAEQHRLSGFDQQIQLEQQLADVYQRWQRVTAQQHQQVLHLLFRGLLVLLGLLAALVVLDQATERVFHRLPREQKRLSTLRRLTRMAFILVGITGTLMTLFGRPGQLATLLGLTGAGLTVAFQDALLSMAGWFVLMGRNGIAIGDWVEINGVMGEVIEVGLLRTVLLETGNWTEPGHPTGRKVFCPNSFAFRSPYFNFTSTRQWLWDELQMPLPAEGDPRHLVASLAEVVHRETESDAEAAAHDHQSAQRLQMLHSIPTAAAVQLRPGPGGLNLCIRYVTTVQRRSEVRERLYQAMLTAVEREQREAGPAASSGRAPA